MIPRFLTLPSELPRKPALIQGAVAAVALFVLLGYLVSKTGVIRTVESEYFGPEEPGRLSESSSTPRTIEEEPRWKQMLRMLALPVPEKAKPSVLPQTPPAERASEWLDAYNQLDPNTATPGDLGKFDASREQLDIWKEWRKELGKLQAVKTAESRPERIVVLVQNERGSWWRMLLALGEGGRIGSVKMEAITLSPSADHVAQIVDAFALHDRVILADAPGSREDAELRLRVIRHPRLPERTREIVFACASAAHQKLLDRYVRGEDIDRDLLAPIWRDVAEPGRCDSPVYERFLAAVRSLNKTLAPDRRLRVLGGSAAVDWAKVRTREEWLQATGRKPVFTGKQLFIGDFAGVDGFRIARLSGEFTQTDELEDRILDPTRPVLLGLGDSPVGRLLRATVAGGAVVYTGMLPDFTVTLPDVLDTDEAYRAERARRQKAIAAQ